MTDKLRPLKIRVKVIPKGSRNQILGMDQGALKIKLTAPPLEGKANKALQEFLAKRLGLSKKSVEIVSGHGSRLKTVKIEGLTRDEIFKVLLEGINS